MKLSSLAKGWLYAVFTAAVLAFSLWFQKQMHVSGGLEKGYFSASMALALAAFTVLGIGVYTMLSFRKSSRRKIPVDALLWAAVGFSMLVAAVAIIVSYGGLSRPFGADGYTAANLMTAILSVLPLPWMVRLLTLAFCKGQDASVSRTVLRCVAVAFILLVPMLVVTEQYFCFFYFE